MYIGMHGSLAQDVEKLKTDFNQVVEAHFSAGHFSGTISVYYQGEIIYTYAKGVIDHKSKEEINLDTKFNVGSMNKMHTAVAIMQLVEDNIISLDQTVGEFLPDFDNERIRNEVTIRQLLNHSAGLGNYLQTTMHAPPNAYVEVSDYLPVIENESLRFAPGSRFSYSNSGFMLLGAIIEVVTGRSYDQYVQDEIFGILKMSNTGFAVYANEEVPNLAKNYTRWFSADNDLDPFVHPGKGGPAGGGYSTVGDWIKFGLALKEHKIISEASFRQMTEGIAARENSRYSYGMILRDIGGLAARGHGGGAPGINGELEFYENSDFVIAVLSNIDPPSATIIKRAFQGIMLREMGWLPAPDTGGNASFTLEGYESAKVVSVLGSFDGYEAFAHFMQWQNGQWHYATTLDPGTYQYYFLVDGIEVRDESDEHFTIRVRE